ncbi:MAG: glycosyltransferase [Coriobacteriales bacterium]|nr:glycosyltransferase [Coriobacteriales bacterium]
MSRTKILMFQESWGRGGIESFVMNMVRGLDPAEFEVELLSAYDWDNSYDAELASLGVKRTVVFPGRMPGLATRFWHGTRTWRRMLSAGDVDVVHVNAMNGMTLAYAAVAKRCGVPIRVVHSHNNDFGSGVRAVKLLFHRLGKVLWGGAATMRLACSHAAGTYLFGRRSFELVPNGIDVERFAFSTDARSRIRKALGVAPDALVVGSIGRISHQKNSLFCVRVLAELKQLVPNACLLLVGDGELVDKTQELADELGVAHSYLHVEAVANPEDYYAAMDVFLMPSLFEGFGYALVEAQCSGLPCIVSEAVQDEACITDLVRKVPLAAGAIAWAQPIQRADVTCESRPAYAHAVASAGLAVDASVDAIRSVYALAATQATRLADC